MKKRSLPVSVGTVALCLAALPLPAGDFPRWRGQNSGGSAGEAAVPLARSWDEVRVGWVSETLSPHPWNYSVVRGRTQWPRTVLGNGGYCMPAVSGGKVYVGFRRPSGTVEITVSGTEATGTYSGTYDVRTPLKGVVTGTYASVR